MIDSHELIDNLDRSFRNNDLQSIQTDISRLKTINPRSWQKKCTNQEPLIQISDSVLTDVKIILNINQNFNDIIAGNEGVEKVYSNLGALKATLAKITKQISKAKLWLKTTETDRWLQQLMLATKNSPEERKVLAEKLAKAVIINRKKREKIDQLHAKLAELRAKSRAIIEQKWEDRKPRQSELNEQQQKAVNHDDGRLVITAGPGSGKTHVLVERINNLIEKGCQPSRILMLTFTVKATNEMSSRVEKRLSLGISGTPEITNFNGFCKSMIEADYQKFGFTKRPTHIEPKFRRFLMDDLIDDGIEDDLVELINNDNRIRDITMRLDSLLHNRCVDAKTVLQWFEKEKLQPLEEAEAEFISQGGAVSKSLEEYRLFHSGLRLVNPLRNHIRKKNGLTFGDQITLFYQRLSSDKTYLQKVCEDYDHVLVDEFQDNNLAQGEIVKLMSEHLKSTCVVGDPNQAIFRFRGANVRNLEDFLEAFENTSNLTRIDLDTCYRHSQNIIDLSDALIDQSNSSINRPKVTTGWVNDDSTNVRVCEFIDEASEAVEHAKWVMRQNLLGYEYDEMVILARSLNYVEIMLNHFDELKIPYVTTSSGTLFRDDLSVQAGMLLRACIDPVGNVQAVQYLLNSGFMGVLKEDAAILHHKNRRTQQRLFDSIISIEGEISNRDALAKLHNFIEQHSIKQHENLNDWMFRVLKDSGFISDMLNRGPNSQLSNLISILSQELVNAGNFFNNPHRFGFYLSQLMEGKIELEIPQVSKPGHIVVSTIHKAKGLEWNIVLLPSLDERKPPSKEIQDRAENLILADFFEENIESESDDEKIRLFYVGITRVIDNLVLSRPLTRTDKSKENLLFSTAAEHYPVFENNNMHLSLLNNPLTPDETNLLSIRKSLEQSIDNIGAGRESEDLKLSIRALLTYHLEKLAIDERSLSNDTRELISSIEKTVGQIKYNEFINEDDEIIQRHWRPEYFTWSMLSSYRDCPQKFAFSYVHKLINNQSKVLTRGNIVHAIVEQIGQSSKRLDWSEVEEIIKQNITAYENIIPMLSNDELSKISDAIKIWYSDPRSANKVVAIEKGIEFNYEGRKFFGKVDRVEIDEDGRLRMIDFKTGKPKYDSKGKPINKPGTSKHEQLLLYSHAWNENFKQIPEVIAYDFTMHNIVVPNKINPITLDKGLARLIPLMEGIESNDFHATPDMHTCKYCDHSSLCPDKV